MTPFIQISYLRVFLIHISANTRWLEKAVRNVVINSPFICSKVGSVIEKKKGRKIILEVAIANPKANALVIHSL